MFRRKCSKLLLLLPLIATQFSTSALAQVDQQQVSSTKMPAAEDWVEGEWIVQFKNTHSKLSAKSASKLERLGKSTAFMTDDRKTLLVKGEDKQVADLVKELAQDPEIAFVEPNYRYYTDGSIASPNDPSLSQQWGLDHVNAQKAWEAVEQWKGEKKGSVTVAVVDTGIDPKHPDLKGRILPGYSTLDDSLDFHDDVGHGTHVAGIIAANTNNGKGIAGVSGTFPVKILPIRALGKQGGTSLTVAAGIEKAIEANVDVINMSLGGTGYSQLMRQSIKRATDKGILVVVSAGNRNTQTDNYFPAGYNEVVTVSSVNEKEEASDFSNFGAAVDLAAPGEQILSTMPDGKYEHLDGTSMAAPFVSGAAALVKLTHPDWGVEEIRSALQQSARDILSPGFDAASGHGMLNVQGAILHGQVDPLQIVSPAYGSDVFGQTKLSLKTSDSQVKQVRILTKEGKILGTVAVDHQRAELTWDTASVKPGRTTLLFEALDQTGKRIGDVREWLVVVRDQQGQGIGVTATMPSGEPAVGTTLSLLKDSETNFVYQGTVNEQGQTFLPKISLLPGETYTLYAIYRDDLTGENYLYSTIVTGKMTSINIDFGKTSPVQIKIDKKGKSLIGNSRLQGSLYLRPELKKHPYQSFMFAYQIEIRNGQAVMPRLVPGTYHMQLQGVFGDQDYILLDEKVEIGSQNASISVDLDEEERFTFKLPKWADAMLVESSTQDAPYLPIRQNGNLYMSKEGKQNSSISLQLVQKTEEKVWIYKGYSLSVDSSSNRTIDLNKPLTLQVNDYQEQVVSEGSYVYVPVTFLLSDQFTLSSIYSMDRTEWESRTSAQLAAPALSEKDAPMRFLHVKDGFLQAAPIEDDAWYYDGPELYLTDGSGKEVYRRTFEYEWRMRNDLALQDGTYDIHVDVSKLPIPTRTNEAKVTKITFVRNAPTLTVLGPDGLPFDDADLIISDPQTGEVQEQRRLSPVFENGNLTVLPSLTPDKVYKVNILGMTNEKERVYFEREMTIPQGRSTIDLSQKLYKPQQVKLDWGDASEGNGAQIFIQRRVTDDVEFFSTLYSGNSKQMWLDPGDYLVTVYNREGDKPFLYHEKLSVTDDTTHLQLFPDLSKFMKVQVKGQRSDQTSWLIGVVENVGEFKLNFLLQANDEQSVYVEPDKDAFSVVQVREDEQGQLLTVMQAKAVKVKNGYRLQVGDRLTSELKPTETEFSAGQAAEFTIKVSDQFGNVLTSGQVITANLAEDLDHPLVMEKTGEQEWQLARYDMNKKEYMYYSQQPIRPMIQLKQGDKVLLEELDNSFWKQASLTLPEDLEPGTYEVVWSTALPFALSASTTIEVKAANMTKGAEADEAGSAVIVEIEE